MAEARTLRDAFVDELRDAYDAETQQTKALWKLSRTAFSPELREAFETHLEETQGHVDRLELVFATLYEKARGRHCGGIAGIIEEGRSVMEANLDDITMDACREEALEPGRGRHQGHGRCWPSWQERGAGGRGRGNAFVQPCNLEAAAALEVTTASGVMMPVQPLSRATDRRQLAPLAVGGAGTNRFHRSDHSGHV